MPPARPLYVTDTHPFVWYLVDDASPGSRARIAYDPADSGEATIIIPAIVLAESLYLAEKGRIKARSEQIFGTMDNALNYRIYPLDLTIIQKAWELKRLTEIGDRTIVATAKHLNFELITRDGGIRDGGYVQTLW